MKMFNAVVLAVVLVLVLLMGAREGFVAGYPKNNGSMGMNEVGSAENEEECRKKANADGGTAYIFRQDDHPNTNQQKTCQRVKYGCNPIKHPTMDGHGTHSTGCTDKTREFPNCASGNCNDPSNIQAWINTIPRWMRW